MDYTQTLAEIKKGLFRPVYLLQGEESFLAKKLEKAIVEALLSPEERDMNLTVLEREPQLFELANLIETVPFMGGKNVIIIRGTNLFRAGKKGIGADGEASQDKTDERLLTLLAEMPDYTCLLFVTSEKADKRKKLYKVVEQVGAIVDLSPLKPKDVKPWILAKVADLGRKISPDALEYLLSAISMMPQVSLGFLDQELEKAALYTLKQSISRQDLLSVMSALPEVSVFSMVEALSQKQTSLALKLLEDQLTAGENAIRLLALLARQVRLLWLSKDLLDRGIAVSQLAERLALPTFVGEKLGRQSKAFTTKKLKEMMAFLAIADHDLKTGRTDKFVLERIIIEMCS